MSTTCFSKNFFVKFVAVVAAVVIVFGFVPVLDIADVSINANAETPVYDSTLGSYTTSTDASGNTVLTATPNDLKTKVALKWDEENLYVGAEVFDDVFYSTGFAPKDTWNLDSFQLALLYDPQGKIKSTSTFEEIAFSYLDKVPTIYRHKTIITGLEDATKVENAELAITQNGNNTYYEAKLPWSSILPDDYVRPTGGTELKFALILNDNDGMGRKGYYKLGDGIGNGKNSSKFMTILLAE